MADSPTTTREAVLATAKRMLAAGLVEGTSGNISGRLPDGLVCLTPSSVDYDTMTLDDLVVVDLDGAVVAGTRPPTTEKDLHLSTLRRYPELGAVIHTHAVYATMFALAHEPIPAVIEEVVVYLGGDVPC
ncbi:MAG TPA: class II aldolase/adducin family protein, partial [Acidimicrobiales bacterium]